MAVSSRFKLRCDTYTNWQNPVSIPLYEGEIGIGYDIRHNAVTGEDEKYNFKIKIGRSKGQRNFCSWNDAADLKIANLDPEDLQAIADEVVEQLGEDKFVSVSSFNIFKTNLNAEIQQIKERLSTRVKACVSDAVLLLLTDD